MTGERPELVANSGRDKIAESTDPYIATVVTLSTPGYDGVAEMARTLIEEFAVVGWPRERILRMFKQPTFAGPYAVYEDRGLEFVEALIGEVLGADDEKGN